LRVSIFEGGVAMLALAWAGPAAAVTPVATEDALAAGALALAAPGLAACLAGWTDAVGVIEARLILPAREEVSATVLHVSGVRTGCGAALRAGAGDGASVTARYAIHPESTPRMSGGPVFAPERRCSSAQAVPGRDGRTLGWLEATPCR
jgi:hypothetical protein